MGADALGVEASAGRPVRRPVGLSAGWLACRFAGRSAGRLACRSEVRQNANLIIVVVWYPLSAAAPNGFILRRSRTFRDMWLANCSNWLKTDAT